MRRLLAGSFVAVHRRSSFVLSSSFLPRSSSFLSSSFLPHQRAYGSRFCVNKGAIPSGMKLIRMEIGATSSSSTSEEEEENVDNPLRDGIFIIRSPPLWDAGLKAYRRDLGLQYEADLKFIGKRNESKLHFRTSRALNFHNITYFGAERALAAAGGRLCVCGNIIADDEEKKIHEKFCVGLVGRVRDSGC